MGSSFYARFLPPGTKKSIRMLWPVFQVIFYKIITLNHLKASEIANPAVNSSENQEILFVHNVQPLEDAVTLNLPLLLSGVRLKLREIFAIQFPNVKYYTRNYDIENWPQNIDFRESKRWRKDELVRINAGIPYYKFVRREKAAKEIDCRARFYENLKNIECLKIAALNENYVLKKMLKVILERFKVESGKPDASSINWNLLDRSQIPSKYEDIPLNSVSFHLKYIFKNAEIVDNIHFYRFSDLKPLDDQIDICGSDDKAEITPSRVKTEESFDVNSDSMYENNKQVLNHSPESHKYLNDNGMEITDSDSDFDSIMQTLTDNTASNDVDTQSLMENSNEAVPEVQSNLNPELINMTLLNEILEDLEKVRDEVDGISNVRHHDEVVRSRDYKVRNSSNNKDIASIHNVQPLKHAEILDGNILKAAVRQKLREIFAIQFPNDKYDTRKYDIKNWPEGIESHGTINWRKDELVRINERIPFYKFVPRKEAFKVDSARKLIYDNLKNMECLKDDSLQNQITNRRCKKLMLDRFRIESGKTDATSIDWRLLDRKQIPLKYKDVPLNGSTLAYKLIFQNAEIVDNIHFFKYANLNDSNQASDNETFTSDDEVDATEVFGPINEQVDIGSSDDDEYIISDELEIDDQLSLIQESSNNIRHGIKWRDLKTLFDFGTCNENHLKDSVNLSSHQIDFIHGTKLSKLKNNLKTDLNILLKTQYPDEEFKMANYEIRNWPEGVGQIPNAWTKAQIKKIYEKMPTFVFVERSEKLPIKPTKRTSRLENLNGILDKTMTYEETYETLLSRFRQESGQSTAETINWKLLDRRDIPSRYDVITIDKYSICLQRLYKNPEIVNNIHFFKSNELEKVSHKRKSEELEIDHLLEDFYWPTS